MVPDYHTHTPLCGHASGLPVEYARAARARGVPELCVTDHAPDPDGFDARHRMTMAQVPEYLDLVTTAAEVEGIQVLRGFEADYYRGCERHLGPWLAAQDLDLVLGSVHHVGDWPIDHPDGLPVWESMERPAAWGQYFECVGELASTGLYDIVAHLDLPKKFGHSLTEAGLRELAPRALDPVAAAGMCIELNTSGLRRPVGEIYPSRVLLVLARERDIPITFGSDAHCPEEVGFAFEQAIALARDAGYTHRASYRRRERTLVPLPDPKRERTRGTTARLRT